jgi:hypothetical protein
MGVSRPVSMKVIVQSLMSVPIMSTCWPPLVSTKSLDVVSR